MYVTVRGVPGSTASAPASSAPEPGGPGEPSRRLVRGVPATVLALGVVSFFTDISSEAVVAVLPLYVTAVLGLSPVAYGFLDGVHQGVSAAVRILGGWWADRSRQPKWVAVTGYGVSALSRFLLLPVTGFAALTGVVALDRLGKGLRTGPRDAMIADASDPSRLGRDFGVHRAMDTAGALVGPLLAFAVLVAIPVGVGGYRSVFVLSAAAAVIGLAVLVIAVPQRRRADPAVAAAAVAAPRMRWRDLTDRRLRRVLVAAGLLGLLTVGDGFLYLVLAASGSFGASWFPLLMVGTNAAYLLAAVPLGRLADRVGRGRVFLAGHVLLVAAYALTATRPGGAVAVVAVLLLLGVFYAATDGVLAALTSRLVPAASRASGIAAAQTVVALSRFGASVGFGLLWQLTGRSTALLVVGVGMTLVLPVAAALLRAPRTAVTR
ncbi:MFS transporter [Microlunatus capsulatus]|uniref:MFS family permease n=1 Tax=Microlunatus capsulatus TaxID=99117 RepID=A0ABS4ZC13_9ACTN|nr:MFS transporter [Microlunatus capsulatus]MBP2418549.1 MFS family permease [Microlunatus capsulatus]